MKHVHTIPVDASLTVDEAWHELCRGATAMSGAADFLDEHLDDSDALYDRLRDEGYTHADIRARRHLQTEHPDD